MTDDRLPTALWLEAHLKQLTIAGTPYYILQKGAYASGTILLKLNVPKNGCMVLQQQRDENDKLGWLAMFDGVAIEEAKADHYINRARARDPDLWVVEIESQNFQNPLAGKII